ncbi:hypothetical protein GH714_019169 [Hevea brasiliensis]|uniref:Disease resistance R13L4/SHOC-2-like LRR domain-containing protein n=1 Tax=Hevea brasiliensis TaxID=3981 RepID=A0A6A6N5J7_HEVBR|nr:hypothetical protein GH714_019169 [Hevea brasiliensis]
MSDSVVGYVDSDFAGDLDKRRSLTGYLFTLSGNAINWKTTLQGTVALSTIEAVKEALWFKALGNLKFLYLSDSLELTRVPELSSIPKLELLFLDGCRSLIEIPSSIGELKCLKEISLIGCEELHSIQQSICNLKFLTRLDISYCLNVTELPENIGDLELLEFLCIIASGIKTLPSSINQLKNLRDLACGECEGLALPPLTGLSRLWRIDLRDTVLEISHCLNVNELPENIGDLELLETLDISGSGIKTLPSSFNQLQNLGELTYGKCEGLTLPPLTEHVFLWNDSFDMEDGPVAASFQFFVDRVFVKAKYRKDRDYSAIIKCGVHPIFGDDCLGRDNKKRSRSQEDEDDELSFQRLKQDQEPSHTLDKSDSE